ncbi:hypothetical protein ES703_103637 [subsurface metagenome]
MQPEQDGFGSILTANEDPLLDAAQGDLFQGGNTPRDDLTLSVGNGGSRAHLLRLFQAQRREDHVGSGIYHLFMVIPLKIAHDHYGESFIGIEAHQILDTVATTRMFNVRMLNIVNDLPAKAKT